MQNRKIEDQMAAFLESGKLQKYMDQPNVFGMKVGFCLELFLNGLHHADEKQLKKVDWQNPNLMRFNHRGLLQTGTNQHGNLINLITAANDLGLSVDLTATNFGIIAITFYNTSQRELLERIEDARGSFGWRSEAKPATRGREKGKLSPNQTMTLQEAVETLNTYRYKPKGAKYNPVWCVSSSGDRIFATTENPDLVYGLDAINAVHRARQLIRRNITNAK